MAAACSHRVVRMGSITDIVLTVSAIMMTCWLGGVGTGP